MSSPRLPGRTALSARLLVTYAVAYIILIGLMAFIVDRSTREALLENLTQNLEVDAGLAAQSLPDDRDEVQPWAQSVFDVGGFRVTVIRADGTVLGDSHSDPAVMEDHSTRPEVVAALAGETGTSTRVSASTGFEQLYVALPPEGGVVMRVSVPTRVINEELNSVRQSVIAVSIVIGLLGVAAVWLIGRRLAKPIGELTELSNSVAAGELDVSPPRSQVVELDQLGLAIGAIANDLGERVTDAEAATEYLKTVLGVLPEGTVLIEGETVAYSSEAAQLLLGGVPDQLGGLTPLQIQTTVREAREIGRPAQSIVDHGKPARRLRAIATPLGVGEQVVLTLADITDAERLADVRRDFVANASHELKTPVTTIIASTEALRIAVGRGDETALDFAARVESSARQLDRLLGDLLDLSRLERELPDMAPVRLDLLARDEVERIRGDAESKGLALHMEADAMVVDGSHRDLAIAVRNLLDNATRYTSDGGSVELVIAVEENEAVLSVADTGDGIPTRDLDRVFERFYRVDVGRSRTTGGTGLGLSIVRHVAVSHGGSVEVESELGVGSTFTIRLPLPAD